jgi:argininosuccinate synthase
VPDLELHTPIRALGWSREREAAYLAEHGVAVPPRTTAYSVNAGLWGTTIGGRETHDAWVEPPALSTAPAPSARRDVVLGFERGLPVALDGERLPGLRVVESVRDIGAAYGVGNGIHIGDTVIGIKGRIAFAAPAPHVLIAAHRELEKLVLTRWQAFWKDHLADFYGQQLHEGLYFDPVMRDIEALIASSQACVSGEARVRFEPGRFSVTGVRSPHSLLDAQAATYGETSRAWNGDEAAAFAKLHALPMSLAVQARQRDATRPHESEAR